MFLFNFNVAKSVIFGAIFMLAIKIYFEITKGVCRSKKRLVGKTVIITGANTGIGKETALDLALRGGRIILACRDLKKANLAKGKIITSLHNLL